MIAPTITSEFDKIVKKMIFNSEGQPIRQPSIIRGNDHTVTYGYGYTFIRKDKYGKWSIYENLEDDLFEIGIFLYQQQNKILNDLLKDIVTALNNKNYNLADQTIVKLNQEWKARYSDLTDQEAQTLYETEIQHKKD